MSITNELATKVKICGLSRMEDIIAVNAALPDYIGFVFAQSRRRVDESTAAMLKKQLDCRITAVGVFVNQELETIAEICKSGIIDLVQLHGNEDEDFIRNVKLLTGKSVIKANSDSMAADYLLYDSITPGSGQTFDWSSIGKVNKPFFLAGGLRSENVMKAIKTVAPFAVDVSSGVETDGVKDADKIEQFVRLVRA